MNFELFIAKRLSESKLSRYYYSGPIINICQIAICISLAIMILSVSIGKGLQLTIMKNINNTDSEIVISHINQKNETDYITLSDQELLDIHNIKAVQEINPIVTKSAIINTNNNIKGVIIKGIDLQYKKQLIKKHIIEGSYISHDKENELLISKQQAQQLKLKIGDKCLLYFMSKNNSIQKRLFSITGIFDMNNEVFNDNFCFSKQTTLQKINRWSNQQFSKYEVSLKKDSQIEKITQRINNNLKYDLVAKSIYSRFSNIFNWITLFDKNILFLMMIMCMICVINMTNALLILILERLKMIGTLKSFGCTNSSILKIFLYNSVKITKKGLLYGNIIGLLLCYMQKTTHIIQLNPESYFIDYVPIDINIKYIILINILTFIIIQISIIIPYGIIKKINPANILKIN